jgi:pimeloyl-ACP methyl ester carboxylesterase
MSQVVVKKLLISYFRTDEKVDNEKCLLFLHGWRSNKEIWQGTISQMGNIKCQSYLIDLPGFGGSQKPSIPFTVGDYAAVVADFIQKLELKNAIIIGHSFGGRVGIKLAADYPSLLAKLVLVDSAGFAINQNKKKAMKSLAKIAKPFFNPEFMQPLRKKIYTQIGAEDYLATPELQKTFINVTSEDMSKDLKSIKVPTLIINGEKDLDTPVKYGERMHELISNSEYLVLKGAGHFSFLDKPEGFIKALESFV